MTHLTIVKGRELADGVVAEMRLPESLMRFSIGRDPTNHWPIPDRTLAISARHCEIVGTAAGVALRDLSTNGTFVNGGNARLAGDHLLRDGDRIELGPYTIAVHMPRAHPAAATPRDASPIWPLPLHAASPGPAAVRSPGVEDTAPLRGGDPAAMLGAGGRPAQVRLTEILRNAPPAHDSEEAVTKIRAAPRRATPSPAPASDPAPLPAPSGGSQPARVAQPLAEAVPAPMSAGGGEPLLRQLALALGAAPDALSGHDPAEAIAQVGALARAAVTALRQLLDQQSQSRRQIGSRAPVLLPVREVNPLRAAATPEAALLALLAPGADVELPLRRACAELTAHEGRLMAAYRDAARRLGEEMAPASLEGAIGLPSGTAFGVEHRARLWELYVQLWQSVGLAPGQPWDQGFLEAALLHLASAYDAQGKP